MNQDAIEDLVVFDPLKDDSTTFFNLLYKLDGACFGDKAMGMDKWVMLDCAIMPGGIFGFAIESKDITTEIKKFLNVKDDYKGLVPLSMFIAIPMANNESWFAHNLSSLNSQLKTKIKSLGYLTKLHGLNVLNIKKLMGITQWDSDSLFVHTKIAPMKILRAYTPIHTHPNSLVYECDLSSDLVVNSSSFQKIDPAISEEILNLQKAIDSGGSFYLNSAPENNDLGRRIVKVACV